jgi:acyl-coenzyme A synthetase/AMP-(fatty) acid ligase
MRRFDLENFLANIEKYQINEMGIVPPIVIAIIMSGLAKKYSMASVRYIGVGAAPLGKASQDRIRELMSPEARVNQVWGMTEMTCVASQFPYPADDTSGSVGYFLPNVDAKYISSSAIS